MELKVQLVPRARRVTRVLPELQVHQVPQAHWVHKVHKVKLARKGCREPLVPKVLLVLTA
jgi:hypothetical protein